MYMEPVLDWGRERENGEREELVGFSGDETKLEENERVVGVLLGERRGASWVGVPSGVPVVVGEMVAICSSCRRKVGDGEVGRELRLSRQSLCVHWSDIVEGRRRRRRATTATTTTTSADDDDED